MTKFLTFAALALGVAAALLLSAIRHQRQEIASLTSTRDATMHELTNYEELERTIITTKQQSNTAAAELTAIENAIVRSQAQPTSVTSPADPSSAALERLRDSRGYAPFHHREQRRFVQKQLGEFFAVLNLAPTDLDHFKDLLVERLDAQRDARLLAEKEGFAADSREARALKYRVLSDTEKNIRDFLNPEDYERYQDFVTIQRNRGEADEVQLELADAGLASLSGEQLWSLAKTYRDVGSDPRHVHKTNESAEDFAAKRISSDSEIVERMRPVLSADQIATLATHLSAETGMFIRLDVLTR